MISPFSVQTGALEKSDEKIYIYLYICLYILYLYIYIFMYVYIYIFNSLQFSSIMYSLLFVEVFQVEHNSSYYHLM